MINLIEIYTNSILIKINKTQYLFYHPWIILFGIFAYELMKINLQLLFKTQSGNAALFDNVWVLSSIFGSTFLGALSDRYIKASWRKCSVLLGMLSSLISSLFLIYINNLSSIIYVLFFTILNGGLGCYIGAIRAFYLDKFQDKKSKHFVITIVTQCLTWIVFGCLLRLKILSPINLPYFANSLMIISIFGIAFFCADSRCNSSEESKSFIKEAKAIFSKYNHLAFWLTLIAFLFLAVNYQIIPYSGEFLLNLEDFYLEIFLLGIGVGLGAFVSQFFFNYNTYKILQLGYLLAFLFFTINLIFFQESFQKKQFVIFWGVVLIYGFIGGGLWALSVREFLNKAKLEEGGVLLGLIESVQSLGEFLGSEVATVFSSSSIGIILFQSENFSLKLYTVFSMISFVIILAKIGKSTFKTSGKEDTVHNYRSELD